LQNRVAQAILAQGDFVGAFANLTTAQRTCYKSHVSETGSAKDGAMINRSSEPLRAWFQFWDIVCVALAWLLADFIRLRAGWIPIYADDFPSWQVCVGQLPLVVVLTLVVFRLHHLYDISRMSRLREELHQIAKSVGVLTLFIVAITFAMQSPYRPRLMFGIFATLAFALVMMQRRLSWFTLGRLRTRGYNQSHALIVGTGRLARQTAQRLRSTTWMGIRTVAYVTDDADHKPLELPIVGPIEDLPKLVEDLHIEHVFIALPMNRYSDVRRVFDILSQTVVEVRLIADVPAMSALSLTTTTLHGMTVIGLRENNYFGINVVVKRFMDIIIAATAIVLLSPLLALIAVLVKATSRGPVLYRQERCSMNGQRFMMLKFRSMRANAEAGTGAVMTTENDPRRTRIGEFLRKTNLDELPQLWNILIGEMSLVGPRPERPEFVEQFKHTIPNYMARHAVKAGLTGWAQVNGWRGNSSLRRRVQYDLYYITHWNPLFDLRIMILTVVSMVLGKQRHAY
jgi:Undecaprenyl-phosphate glucose phosphotransferase